MERIRSDAYAVVSLAFALSGIFGTLTLLFSMISSMGMINLMYGGGLIMMTSYVITPLIPIAFGIVGLKSSARKIAIAGIVIAGTEMVLKVLCLFALPLAAFMFGGGW